MLESVRSWEDLGKSMDGANARIHIWMEIAMRTLAKIVMVFDN